MPMSMICGVVRTASIGIVTEIVCWEVVEDMLFGSHGVAVTGAPDPELALDGDGGVEIGFIDMAVEVFVMTVGGFFQAEHFGVRGVPPYGGHAQKPSGGVHPMGGVERYVGVWDI